MGELITPTITSKTTAAKKEVAVNKTIVALIGLLLLSFLWGCAPPKENVAEYFPSQAGTTWTYKIEVVGDARGYEDVDWPYGSQTMSYSSRKRFEAVIMDPTRKDYTLTLQVKGPAPQQGPLQYPKGVELTVLTDDLGVYADAKQLFWAIREDGGGRGFAAEQVVTYDPSTSSLPQSSLSGEDGFAMRILFLDTELGSKVNYKGSNDSLTFVGPETIDGQTQLHFRREIQASNEPDTDLEFGKGFTEDVWYAKGVGLVRLEQKVDGQATMTWTLVP